VLEEFKKFIGAGNVVDLAVGVIIGGMFGKIVASFVEDVVNPTIGAVVGSTDFSNLYFVLSGKEKITAGMPLVEAKKVGAVLAYGNFASICLNTLMTAFVIFLAVKAINNLRDRNKAKEEPVVEPPAGPTSEQLLGEIRDLLKAKN
jgi:large conductance mechanosensitive channel